MGVQIVKKTDHGFGAYSRAPAVSRKDTTES